MMSGTAPTLDLAPGLETFLKDALLGLRQDPKELPCKYLYDAEGSRLFEAICELPEYYPTRTELSIMYRSVGEMAQAIGPRALLIEFGSGAGLKTEVLLDALDKPVAYVPLDISPKALEESVERLARRFPGLRVLPVCADYTEAWEIPTPEETPRRQVIYFPGSTIGNFDRGPAEIFLRRLAHLAGPRGGLLIGVDLKKEREVLEAAYDDAQGVTAAFNRNYLVRLNRELDADFDLQHFRHRAVWNEADGRVEMHLESLVDQEVHLGGETLTFRRGETICTEHSNKYGIEEFGELAGRAGFTVRRVWTDPEQRFSVQWLTVR
jgi:dimethylhistidine N-methyltransferase